MQKWSMNFRVWHWLNAVVVLGLLGTVFLRKTFLSWRSNSELLIAKLAEIHIDLTSEQAKIIARAIRAPMWEWHIILGYALGAMLVWRLLLFWTQSGRENYRELDRENLHKKAVKFGYILFYLFLLFMSISGLALHFDRELGLSKAVINNVKELHEYVYYTILIFVPLHIIGVLVAENRNEKGIISDMVNGGGQK